MDKNIVFNANSSWYLFNFRKNSIASLVNDGFKVICIAPEDEYTEKLKEYCTEFISVSFKKSSTNLFHDLMLIIKFSYFFLKIKPKLVFNFTIKNNIYGAIAGYLSKTKVVNNISGLGSSMLLKNYLSFVITFLYKVIKNIPIHTHIQNNDDFKFLKDNNLINSKKASVLPGSGVDIEFFKPWHDNKEKESFSFIYVGRLIADKGIIELLDACKVLRDNGKIFCLNMVLKVDKENPSSLDLSFIEEYENSNYVKIFYNISDVRELIAHSDCFVLPSYREGLSRSALEAMAMAKPLILSNVPGCSELVFEQENGFLCDPRSSKSLARAMINMLDIKHSDRINMGNKSRKIVEDNYDEKIVINKLFELIS